MCLNAVRKFGGEGSLLAGDKGVHRMVEIVTGQRDAPDVLLYGPLSCRASYTAAGDAKTTRLVTADVYVDSERYLIRCRARRKTDRNNLHGASFSAPSTKAESPSAASRRDEEPALPVTTTVIERDGKRYPAISHLNRYANSYWRRKRRGAPRECDASAFKGFQPGARSDEKSRRTAQGTEAEFADHVAKRGDGKSRRAAAISNDDAVRDYLSTAELDEYATETVKKLLNSDANGGLTREPRSRAKRWLRDASGLSGETVRNIAVTYLFLLARERERELRFGRGGAAGGDGNADGVNWRDNWFARFSKGGWRDCRRRLCALYPEMYIQSLDTNMLAKTLALYVNSLVTTQLTESLAVSICTCVMSLYIYSNRDMGVVTFFIQYFTACRYPGQFLKSILLLQGTSDSGKSEFVSQVVRSVFSSRLDGSINNSTLSRGNKDEINTDLKSLMRAHVCQCDEPTKINPETLKNIVSSMVQKSRAFYSETPQYLTYMAKLILTTNDSFQVRSDAGLLTRLRFIVFMMHSFKELYPPRFNTKVDFEKRFAAPSVAIQFATRCFARGVSNANFSVGLSMVIDHFGLNFVNYTDSFFTLPDAVSARMNDADLELNVRTLRLSRDGIGNGDTHCSMEMFWQLYRHGYVHNACEYVNYAKAKKTGELLPCPWVTSTRDYETMELEELAEDLLDLPIRETYENAIYGENGGGDTAKLTDARTELTKLEAPITIGSLPDCMEQNALSLKTQIDPYQLLVQKMQFVHCETRVSEQVMVDIMRNFIENENYTMPDARDVAVRMKDRLKMDYAELYTRDNHFTGKFVTRTTNATEHAENEPA